jgi:hypothetical protein
MGKFAPLAAKKNVTATSDRSKFAYGGIRP